MSRIGRAAIAIPSGVQIEPGRGNVRVTGPKGVLNERIPQGIQVELQDGKCVVKRSDDRKPTRALHGLIRALVANMVTGVTRGFAKELEIEGVGYRADVAGKNLKLALGFSHPIEVSIPEGIKVSVDKNTFIRIEGSSLCAVGQFAADIRELRPPEPYKGKGIRYAKERVRRKVGKTGAA